jgi:hypothetical protein
VVCTTWKDTVQVHMVIQNLYILNSVMYNMEGYCTSPYMVIQNPHIMDKMPQTANPVRVFNTILTSTSSNTVHSTVQNSIYYTADIIVRLFRTSNISTLALNESRNKFKNNKYTCKHHKS